MNTVSTPASSVLRRYLLIVFALLLTTGFYLPYRYQLSYPYPLGPQFTPNIKREYIDGIAARQPELMLIGDSVLYLGVDEEALADRLGMRVYSLGVPGSGSAVWYLILKNLVVEAQPRPKYVLILFRDSMLTAPTYRTSGRYFGLVDDFAQRNEPLVSKMAFVDQMSALEQISQQYFPLYSARDKLRSGLDQRTRYLAPALLFNCSAQCTDDAVNSIFGKQRVDFVAMNQAVEDAGQILYTPAALDFDKQLSRSFLPAMIDLARQNGVILIFVRTKTRLFPPQADEPFELRNYTRALHTYLAAQSGVGFIDFAHDDRILDSDFLDGLHFNAEGKARLTTLLADALRPFIQ